MAAKGNQSISISRECVMYFAQAMSQYTRQYMDKMQTLTTQAKYLMDENNVGGGDSQAFRDGVKSVYDSLVTVQSKLDTVDKFTRRTTEIYKITAQAKTKSMSECLDELNGYLAKVKNIT